jgi:transposase
MRITSLWQGHACFGNLHIQDSTNETTGRCSRLFLFFFSFSFIQHNEHIMNAIGIDMSKDSFHAAFDEDTIRQFKNTEGGIGAFLDHAASLGRGMIGVEATGVYHLLLCDRLRSAGWDIRVINPLLTHRLAGSSLRKLKTDRADALLVRRAVMSGLGYLYTDTPEIQALKAIVAQREGLVRMRATLKQQQRAYLMRVQVAGTMAHNGFAEILSVLSTQVVALEREMARYAPDTQRLLRSIPGIGAISAAALVAAIGDIQRFSTPEKLTAYIGLDCRVHQSGTSIHGKGFITKRGNTYLRYILFNAAFSARQRDPELKAFFEKKISEGKHYFSAMCAVERKLIHRIWAVWHRGTPYESR